MSERSVTLGELEMNLVDQGTGHPLVLLHGLGADHSVWRHQIRRFADRYRCVAPDLRGAGRSGRPSVRYSLALFADDVAALCAHLGLAHVHLVGQSLGGIVAQQVAARHPDLVDTLTLVGTSGRAVPPADRPLGPLAASIRAGGMDAVPALVRDLLYPAEFQRRHPEEIAAFAGVARACDPADILEKLGLTADLDHRALLATLEVPALVVAGRQDGVFPLEHALLLADRLPHARLAVFDESGHQPHVDQPGAFNQALEEFLAAHPCTD